MKQTKEKAAAIQKEEDSRAENSVHKERYLRALQDSTGGLDGEQLGQSLGFSKEYTHRIIGELVAEGKIGAQTKGAPPLTDSAPGLFS